MTTTAAPPVSAASSTSTATVTRDELEPLLAAAGSAVAPLALDDARWTVAGPALTAVVDAARRLLGARPSPVGADDDVAPALRLRDLARTSERLYAHARTLDGTPDALADVVDGVRSLQAAVG